MNKESFIKLVFEKAKAAGFTDSEILVLEGEEFEVSVFKGEILEYNSAASDELGLRGLYNGKMGIASTQVYDEEAADQLVRNAIEAASLIENEDEQFIYEGDSVYPEMTGFNEKLENVAASDKIELAKALEEAVLAKDPRIKQTEGCAVMSSSSSRRIVNTKGMDVSFRSNGIGAYAAPVAVDDGKTASGMKFKMCAGFDELKEVVPDVVEKSVKKATDFLHAHSMPTGEYSILMESGAAGTMLRTFSSVFSAESAQKGMSLLSGKEGTTIASEAVSIVDDPLLPGHPMTSCPFDGEGVATYAKNVIEDGKLVTLLHNLKTAKKQGVKTTGNASRSSCSAPVHVAPSNFYIKPGTSSKEELTAKIGTGIMITEMQGMHAGANPVSGDFSLGAKGYVIADGKIGEAVEQITIAGNFYRLLENVVEAGSDLNFGMPGSSDFGSPSLWIKSLAVAGK